MEFEKIIAQLHTLKEIKDETTLTEEDVSSFSMRFDAMNWERWVDNKKISDPILMMELLKFEESFLRTLEVFEYNVNCNENLVLNLLSNNDHVQASTILRDLDYYKEEKIHYWRELEYCLEKADKLANAIVMKANSIRSIAAGSLSIIDYTDVSKEADYKVNRTSD